MLSQVPVLVVDDNETNRRILHAQLTRWQMNPTVVGSGREGLRALTSAARAGHPFSLVVLDANMPEMDGFDVAEAIAEHDNLRGVPIMMLTSSGDHGDAAVNYEALTERLGGDAELRSDVIQIFLEDCPQRLCAIKAAVNARDGEAVRNAAHALKGAAANLSASGLFEAAAILERVGAENRMAAADAAWRRLSTEAALVIDSLTAHEASAA